MGAQKWYTEEARLFSKLTSITLMTWAITFILSLSIGTFYIGHIPVYGIDPDPHSLDSFLPDAIQGINLFSFFFSFVAFFAWPLLTIHLLLNKASFSRTEKLLQLSALLSILIFFMFRFIYTDQFAWHFD